MNILKITKKDISEAVEQSRVMYESSGGKYDVWSDVIEIHEMVMKYIRQSEKFRRYCIKNGTTQKRTFANITKMLKYDSDYYMMWGERSNGKSTTTVLACLIYYAITYMGTVVLKRNDKQLIRGCVGVRIFDTLEYYDIISALFNDRFTNVLYNNKEWTLYKLGENGEKVKDVKACFIGMSLNVQENDKGGQLSFDYDNIFFDEFIPVTKRYLPNEIVLFHQACSTIIRDRSNVKIFMVANANDLFCPYFSHFGIKEPESIEEERPHVYKLDDDKDADTGKIVVFKNSTEGSNKVKSAKYHNVSDPNIKAIFTGEFQFETAPPIPVDQNEKNSKVICYMYVSRNPLIRRVDETDGDYYLLQCDWIREDQNDFLYVHRIPEGYIVDLDKKLVYTNRFEGLKNWVRGLRKPTNEYQKMISLYFATEKVFYEDEKVATIVKDEIIKL